MARKVTETHIYDSEGNFLFTQTVTSYTDDESGGYFSIAPDDGEIRDY